MPHSQPPIPPDPRKDAPSASQHATSEQSDAKPAPIITDYASL